MTRIKLCGLSRTEDIDTANRLRPDYIGFVFSQKSRRYVDIEKARMLRQQLYAGISAVGVFVDEDPETVIEYLYDGVIDIAQLHGSEDDSYIERIRSSSGKPVIKAFMLRQKDDIIKAVQCPADYILLDAGRGDRETFDWSLAEEITRPFFLAGGLDPENAAGAISMLCPFAVDVSSGIETDGIKDPVKAEAFVNAVRRFGK